MRLNSPQVHCAITVAYLSEITVTQLWDFIWVSLWPQALVAQGVGRSWKLKKLGFWAKLKLFSLALKPAVFSKSQPDFGSGLTSHGWQEILNKQQKCENYEPIINVIRTRYSVDNPYLKVLTIFHYPDSWSIAGNHYTTLERPTHMLIIFIQLLNIYLPTKHQRRW